MELRDYQKAAVWAIKSTLLGNDTALVVMSTGSGKSIVIAAFLKEYLQLNPDKKALILFNKVTLLEQLADRFKSLIPASIGVVCGTLDAYETDKQITVASVQSLKPDSHFDLIVVDECHNLDEDGGRYIEIIKSQKNAKVLGFTATPYRHDGYIYGQGKFWNKPCYEKGLDYFIGVKMLVPPIAKQPDHQIDTTKLRTRLGEYLQTDIDEQTLNVALAKDQVIDALNRMIDRKCVVWFCASITHAEMIKTLLIEFNETASIVHSKMDWPDRDQNMLDFTTGKTRHLTFVSVVSEGFDHPPIDCVVLMRPTKSPTLMVQTCGRGLRPSPGKENCLILDYANVFKNLGTLDKPYVQASRGGKEQGEKTPLKACPNCRAYMHLRAMKCVACGYEYPLLTPQKLGLEASQNVAFLSSQKEQEKTEMEVKSVTLSAYQSKKGNPCLKVTYYGGAYLGMSQVAEFFVESPFSWRKWQKRAVELGLTPMPTIESQLANKSVRIPKKVVYSVQDGFKVIEKLIFNEG
jgi:DNA repair protein RadD